jgi:hypothetical protein
MGIKTDIHLVGDNYQWLGSIFYLGFLIWEVSQPLEHLDRHGVTLTSNSSQHSILQIVCFRFFLLPNTRLSVSPHGEAFSPFLPPSLISPVLWPFDFF